MIFTPSSTSSYIAGAGFWATVWAMLFKADTFAPKKLKVRRKIFRWIGKHPVEAIVVSELTNYGIHGVSNPLSVMTAIGGTVVNTIMVMGVWIWYLVIGKKSELARS
jgi:hypothetical protein